MGKSTKGIRNNPICQKCGKKVANMVIHKKCCDKVPPPNELATIFKDGTHSARKLSKLYEVPYQFICCRLALVGIYPNQFPRKVQDTRTNPTCQKCGRIVHSRVMHKMYCDKVPLPNELATIFKNGDASGTELSRSYGVPVHFIYSHLYFAGVSPIENKKKKSINICLKCGRANFRRSLHKKHCDKVPPPNELATIFRDSNTSLYKFAQSCGVDYWFIRRHLIFAGVQLDNKLGITSPRPKSSSFSPHIVCQKCGKKVSRMGVHKKHCDKVPPPNELATIFQNGMVSFHKLSAMYGVPYQFIRSQLAFVGIVPSQFPRKRKVRTSSTCQKCRRKITNMIAHKEQCDKIPPPSELAELFNNGDVDVIQLSRLYGVPVYFINSHLRFTGIYPNEFTKSFVCSRCGMTIQDRSDSHKNACAKVPLPEELVKIYLEGCVSVSSLAKKYGCTHEFMNERLQLTGELISVQKSGGVKGSFLQLNPAFHKQSKE